MGGTMAQHYALESRNLRTRIVENIGRELLYSPALDIMAELYLTNGAMDLPAIADLLMLSPGLSGRWLDILENRGFVISSSSRKFDLTDLGRRSVKQALGAVLDASNALVLDGDDCSI